MKSLFCALAAMSLVIVGCSKDTNPLIVEEAKNVSFNRVTASMDKPITRLYMKEPGVLDWSEDDAIGIFSNKTNQAVKFNYESDNTFAGESYVEGEQFFAFYPYEKMSVNALNSKYVYYELPRSYEGDNTSMPMISISNDQNFQFKQTVGLLHFVVTDVENVRGITLTSNNNEALAGQGYIDLSAEEPVFKLSGADHINSVSLDLSMLEELYGVASNEKAITRGSFDDEPAEGEEDPDEGEYYEEPESTQLDIYIPVPVGTYEKGFNIVVKTSDGNEIKKVSNNPVKVTRASMSTYAKFSISEELIVSKYGKEAAALIAFYKALDGPHWRINTGWCTDAPLSEWYGVTIKNGHVTYIDLINNKLKGDIPSEISDLTNLRMLNLHCNSIFSISEEISKLPITVLNLSQNRLKGELPEWISKMESLEILTLSYNEFEGNIPKSYFSNLKNIYDWDLRYNNLSGVVEAEMQQSPLWQNLYSWGNRLNPQYGGYGLNIERAVTSITLNNEEIVLHVGDTFQLKVESILPENAFNKVVYWQCGQEAEDEGAIGYTVAKVDNNGLVTALNAGYAEIECSAADKNGARTYCKVRVISDYSQSTDIEGYEGDNETW